MIWRAALLAWQRTRQNSHLPTWNYAESWGRYCNSIKKLTPRNLMSIQTRSLTALQTLFWICFAVVIVPILPQATMANGTLSGQVTDRDLGTVLGSVSIQAFQGSTLKGSTSTISGGTYSLSLPAGSYSIVASTANYQTGGASVRDFRLDDNHSEFCTGAIHGFRKRH
jgi:hypothetical protein